MSGEIERIRIDYTTSEYKWDGALVEEKIEIDELVNACGWQWNHLFPIPNEGYPSYILKIEYSNGKRSKLYIDQDEVGNASNVNSKIYLLLKNRLG